MKTPKTFDCVEMKRAAQRKIREQVQGMTPNEEIAFFQAGSREFMQSIEEAKRVAKEKQGNTARRTNRHRPPRRGNGSP